MTDFHVLITGGAGFIGTHLAKRYLDAGHQVTIYDNLSRAGVEKNLSYIREHAAPGQLTTVVDDIRHYPALCEAIAPAHLVLHLASQVAVTASIVDPRYDFETNALGTLNVLEAARDAGNDPIIFYSSTNKVYGGLPQLRISEAESRYTLPDLPQGIAEDQPLDFHSPYGCSKGTGDQYMLDYARIYGLRTIVFRQSCIYGTRQWGTEDQGWMAHFAISALKGSPIKIYGNGKQVRDVLFVEDLVDAIHAATNHISTTAGQVYNIGGGPANSISIWKEFGPLLGDYLAREVPVSYHEARPGDQRFYVSDISKAQQDFGWTPKTSVREGLGYMLDWMKKEYS